MKKWEHQRMEEIIRVYRENNNNIKRTAELLNLNRTTVYRYLKAGGIK